MYCYEMPLCPSGNALCLELLFFSNMDDRTPPVSLFSVKLLFIGFPFMTSLGSGLTLVYVFSSMHMSKTIWIFLHL